MLDLELSVESWPVAGSFAISRGSRTEARVVVASLTDGECTGRGECVPYARYGETVEDVVAAIRKAVRDGVSDRATLASSLPAGAARNALDLALIDLECRRSLRLAHDVMAIEAPPEHAVTCFTLSLSDAAGMAARARAAADCPLLKLKLGGEGDADRLRAVRQARPDARLVADANESWTVEMLPVLLAVADEVGVEMIEQPLSVRDDEVLADLASNVALCADESAHVAADLPRLARLYDAVNIKLDKAGGLTEAIAMAAAAKRHGLDVMVGCMLSTSLAMAPAYCLAGAARWLDLDGPLLLARDRTPAIRYDGGRMYRPPVQLWGGPAAA